MNKFFYRLAGFSLSLFIILASIFHSANDIDFYTEQYEKNNTTQATGMSLEDLEKTTRVLIDYLNDFSGEKTLYLEVTEFGENTIVFDERETLHMIDVQVLYQDFFIYAIAMISASFGVYLFLFRNDRKNFFLELYKGYRFSLCLIVILIAILSVIFLTNFNWFWVNFHHVFFTNDLWLLDAKISTMINMFPLEFFYSMCFGIAIKVLAISALVNVFFYYLKNKFYKN